jgi:hypothetical protein
MSNVGDEPEVGADAARDERPPATGKRTSPVMDFVLSELRDEDAEEGRGGRRRRRCGRVGGGTLPVDAQIIDDVT